MMLLQKNVFFSAPTEQNSGAFLFRKFLKYSLISFPILLFLFLSLAKVSRAVDECYEATGFSGSISSPFNFNGDDANGTYEDALDDQNGFPSFTNGTYFIYSHDGTGNRLDLTNVNGAGNVAFYTNNDSTGADPSTGTWLNNPGGLTAGTITLGECGGGGETGTSTEARISTSSTPNLYFFGFILFFVGFWIMRTI